MRSESDSGYGLGASTWRQTTTMVFHPGFFRAMIGTSSLSRTTVLLYWKGKKWDDIKTLEGIMGTSNASRLMGRMWSFVWQLQCYRNCILPFLFCFLCPAPFSCYLCLLSLHSAACSRVMLLIFLKILLGWPSWEMCPGCSSLLITTYSLGCIAGCWDCDGETDEHQKRPTLSIQSLTTAINR